MEHALDRLIELLDLEALEVNLFRGVNLDTERPRIFGGQVLAQALTAAGRTIDDERYVHSLHAYFLRQGDPKIPIVFEVDRIRDGGSFTTRRVVAVQHGRAIFNLAASFQVHESGPQHGDPMPEVPRPDVLPEYLVPRWPPSDAGEPIDRSPDVRDGIDIRAVGDSALGPRVPGDASRSPDQSFWFRARGSLRDEPRLHAAVVAYASDLTLLGTAARPHQVPEGARPYMMATLDHCMWFHRPFRADDWLLYTTHSPAADGGRGMATGQIFRADGQLAITVAQEGLMRPVS
jgi:acyl-CoA thioesterase-2